MEEKLKKKIENLKDQILDNDAILDFVNINRPCTDDCLVNWYNSSINLKDIDFFEDINSMDDIEFSSSKETDANTNKEIIKDHKNFNVIILHNLEILKLADNINLEIQKLEKHKINFYTFSKKYMEFCKYINLSTDKKSVQKFDLEIFYTILHSDYTDQNINSFLDKLILDPNNYNGTEKQMLIIILVYAYLYAVNINLPKKTFLYAKVNSNIFLLKSDIKFKISYTQDYNIDRYLLNIKEFENDFDESNFLNFYYQNYLSKTTVEREIFTNFLMRLNKNILRLNKKYQSSFIRRVFMLHTILYNSLDEFQVYRTVIDYFNKKILNYKSDNITKNILNLYINLINKIGDAIIYNLIVSYIKEIVKYSDKHENYIFKFKVLSVRSLQDYIDLIKENKESYNNLSFSLDLLYYITKNINKNNFKDILDITNVYIEIHDTLKIEYLFKIVKNYFGNMKICLTFLLNIQDIDILLNYYNLKSDMFSKIILSLQRYTVLITDEDKKKKKEIVRNTSADNLFNSFSNILYKLEDLLIKNFGVEKVKVLKKRSFKCKKIERN